MENDTPLTGQLDDSRMFRVERRRDELALKITDCLSPRRGELGCERPLNMKDLGRCLGFFQALVELQAVIEVNQRGVEAKEQILTELNHPPFKNFPVPDGWGEPCVGYIRRCLYSTQEYPDLNWPLNGGSVPGI